MAIRFEFITRPDNAVQVVFRFLSTLIVWGLRRTSVTPNQVTVARGAIVVLSLHFFSVGDPESLLIAVALFYLFEILDHVDGDLARATRQFSKLGPLLEQFVDTWASRPSNIFGLCVALGMYRSTGSHVGFALFAITNIGRLLWLEYREVFGWVRESKDRAKEYTTVLGARSVKGALRNLFVVLYTWNNTFILLGALLYLPAKRWLHIDSLVVGFAAVAILNNVPWIAIVCTGFSKAAKAVTR